jgi:hydroxypyruvate isomerase
VLREVDASGFKGWIGCEYKPRGDTVKGLAWVNALGVSLG